MSDLSLTTTMKVSTESERKLLSALHLNPDRYQWLPTVYANLPQLVVCQDGLSTEECLSPQNKKWSRLFQSIAKCAEQDSYSNMQFAQKIKEEVELYVHREVAWLKIDESERESEPPLRITLALDDPSFQHELTAQISLEDAQNQEGFVYISLLSGLVVSVPENLLLVVTPVYQLSDKSDENAALPPSLSIISNNHLGPLYLNFYMSKRSLNQSGTSVVFELNFFDSLTRNCRLSSVGASGTAQKRFKGSLEASHMEKNVFNLKAFHDNQIEEIGQPTLAVCDTAGSRVQAYEVRLDTSVSLVVENCKTTSGRFTLVIAPRHRYSFGDNHQWTPAAGVFTAVRESRENTKLKVSEWLRTRRVRDAGSKTCGTESTLCLAVLGDCVNSDVAVKFVPEYFESRDTYKPGLNGFFLAAVQEKLYKSMLLHLKQMGEIKLQMRSIELLANTLVNRYHSLGGRKNMSLVHLRFKKALLYFYAFANCKSHKLSVNPDTLEISDKNIEWIAHNSELVNAEEMADYFCSSYNRNVETSVCGVIQDLSAARFAHAKSIMSVLSTSHTNLEQRVNDFFLKSVQ